ncbi:UbiX family flavin prenyltransferase [Temperatibacter marinus]|uniref:Flavin prenyltransferase UbiX n=1 Tax=Temperatibacter marinus TaxID=1456591 RepID=A0AA52EDL2_9PROT|nr:UbiX family flavin prenyltransferase [Temperatibacter marinus]WND02760.1 UbiX family flavin prenyltransferase [Temperatibacter marinus]
MKKVIIGIGGASGSLYGIRLLEVLKPIEEIETHLVMSKTGRMNIGLETEYTVIEVEGLADFVHKNSNVGASIASGSFKTDCMIVAACSMKNLSGIVHSFADDLLTRAADVILKENRQLILMPRETPLHAGHCELLLKATQIGALVAPPMPALYTKPQTIDEMINHTVGRILDLAHIDSGLVDRWPGAENL